jgi:hypothetical protein
MYDDDDDNNNNNVILYWDKPIITDKTTTSIDVIECSSIDRKKAALTCV